MNPDISCKQLYHTGWTSREGYAIAAVQALAQTTDGYLWLGTDRGLVRFNGTSFSAWKSTGADLPDGRITALAASSKGGLWAAIQKRVVELRGSRVTQYAAVPEEASGMIAALVEDDAGTLWVGGGRSGSGLLATIRDRSLRALDTSSWLPHATVTSLFQDRTRHIWIGTSAGICKWSESSSVGCWLTRPAAQVEAIQSTSSGDIVALDGGAGTIRTFANGSWKPLERCLLPPNSLVKSLLVDRDDCLWIGTIGQGLFRVCNGSAERFTKQEGLTSDLVLSLMEDREGNLWVGTSNGLDRFREPKVWRVSSTEGLSGNACTAVCASREGSVWLGTSVGGLDRLQGRRITRYKPFPHVAHAIVLSLHEDDSGRLWVGTTAGLSYQTAAGFVQVTGPGGQSLDRVVAMADRHGVLWAADSRLGLFRIGRGGAELEREFGSANNDVFELSIDRQGRLWIGYHRGGVSVLDRGTQQFFGAESGLAGGPVQEIYQDGSGAVWVGSGEGLSRYRNGRWTSWGVRQGLPEGVQGITATAEGDLWLLTAAGLLRLSGTELSNTPDSSPSNLSFRVYGPLDGIQFSASRRMVNPRLAQSPDGRVWISTDDGLSTLDPKRLRNNPVAPPVNIEQILVDGRALDISSGTSEFRGRELEIQFAALNLGLPQAVDVRYRLEGFDRDWHLIKGPMRIAYERLPPGNYRFRVVASNPDGVWNNAGATINLRRVPEFYQTIPFQAACVLAVAGMVYAAHRLRMRVLHGRLRLVLRERIRIARELHDTLLQGFAGAVYLIKGASLQSEISPEEGRQRLNSAIDKANQSLKEARHVLACLRLTELENHTLSQALEAAGRSMVSGTSILFRMEVTGRVPELPYEIESELYIVAREAMSNAAAHAAPAHIYLKLAFSPAQIRMSIQDDGIGFEVQEALAKKDHWGLMGMQERVKAIHAAITIDSQPSHGTRIGVAAPLRAARIGHANSRW